MMLLVMMMYWCTFVAITAAEIDISLHYNIIPTCINIQMQIDWSCVTALHRPLSCI